MSTDVKNNEAINPENTDTGALADLLLDMFPDAESPNLYEYISFEEETEPVTETPVEPEPPAQQLEIEPMESKDEVGMADAIAQAIAGSFGEDALSDETAPLQESEEIVAPEPEEASEPAELSAVQDFASEAEEAPVSVQKEEKRQKSKKETRKKERKKSKKKKTVSDEEKQPADAATSESSEVRNPVVEKAEAVPVLPKTDNKSGKEPAFKQRSDIAPRKTQTVHNPGTDYVKITRSSIRVTPKEYFATTFSGIIDRQKEALPPMGVDLKSHEKKLSVLTSLDRMLNPVRYVIFILMMLCLAGRKYRWMTLGFMGGIQGTFVSLLLTLAVMIVCWQSTYRGLRDILYFRFSHESYLLVATILTMVEALKNQNETTLLPILTMSWCVCGMGNLMQSQADLRSLRAVITGRNKIGLRVSEKLWKGNSVIGKAPSGTAGFVRRQAEPDPWHSIHTIFVIPMLVIGLVASAYISAKNEVSYLTTLVTILNISMPVSLALCCVRPYYLLSLVITGQGVVSGWYGIKSFSGKKAVMIYDSDLFPKGTVGHRGVKAYGKMTISQLVSYGASIILRANLGLEAPFTKLLQQTGGQILEVTNLTIQEGGVEGRIHRNRVQLGTYHYMQLMGVSVPIKGSSNGVYIAVNGQLEGLFAIKYGLRSGSITGFHRFVREKSLTSLIVTRNFTVNPAFIERSFKAPITQMLCPKSGIRRRLSQPTVLKGGAVCGFILKEGIGPYSRVIGGARRVNRMGVIYTLFSVCFSLYLMFDTIYAMVSGGTMIDPARVLLVHLLLFLAVEIGARLAIKK